MKLGRFQPIRKIAASISRVREDRKKRGVELPLYFHIDACQAARHQDIHVSRLGVDLMTINGGKLYGPKQSGILYVRSGVELAPLLYGGDQEFSHRSGTENVPSIIGFATAFSEMRACAASERTRLQKLRESFFSSLRTSFPDCIVHGHPERVAPHVVSVAFPGVDNERLLMMLNERGIVIAVGSACRALKDTPSHVLSAIGVPREISQSTVRMTFGVETTEKQTTELLEKLRILVPEAKKLS